MAPESPDAARYVIPSRFAAAPILAVDVGVAPFVVDVAAAVALADDLRAAVACPRHEVRPLLDRVRDRVVHGEGAVVAGVDEDDVRAGGGGARPLEVELGLAEIPRLFTACVPVFGTSTSTSFTPVIPKWLRKLETSLGV